ncbi:MotA/TolQ/ExbB proton channel family protein [Hirschia baltica]|uniref:MotA/TolQ/ExbB proton channel n=1 Tax=Hirschia baltica (strain ATCC 49814 / DSM 5838 / IFAM 1418) TaxID=582402 RepID=C6XP27_HIRBI|nr:MotA/TolQ/ExbB proton channel family protein [Hirschia baltica]ACT60207.1 MotA/TolQ/ExbB proton channel [Hirschia baltica ATCC 49814]
MEPTQAIIADTSKSGGALDLMITGGPVVWLLIVLSIIALTIIIYKLIQFVLLGIGKTEHIERAIQLYRDGNKTEALAAVQGAKDPTSIAVATAIRGNMRPDASDEIVREEVERVASLGIYGLKSQISILDLIGSLSPLLGLLGTVMGMIQAFRAMEAAGRNVDPAILSGGIWAALLTTAAGLIVAIPVVAVSSWFERAIQHTAHRTEDAVTRIFTPDLTHRNENISNEIRAAK